MAKIGVKSSEHIMREGTLKKKKYERKEKIEIILCESKKIGEEKKKRLGEELKKENIKIIRHDERGVRIMGEIKDIERVFGIEFNEYETKEGEKYRGYEGVPTVYEYIHDNIEAIIGLSNEKIAETLIKTNARKIMEKQTVDNEIKEQVDIKKFYTPLDLANLYKFPKTAIIKGRNVVLDGAGQNVAIIQLGGGYLQSDLNKYFKSLGIPIPRVIPLSVDGAVNSPGTNLLFDKETTLDIEVVGSIVPKSTILVYFTQNTSIGIYDAIYDAAFNPKYPTSIISFSYEIPEPILSGALLNGYNNLLVKCRAKGINFFCGSGDRGYTDGITVNRAVATFPSTSPNVVSCGGTTLTSTSTTIISEVVWNNDPSTSATGGGISAYFGKPPYQAPYAVPLNPNNRLRGRGYPDVSAHANPSIGFLNKLLYTYCSQGNYCLNDITVGNNGLYFAHKSWDACTGLGSPNGMKIYNAMNK